MRKKEIYAFFRRKDVLAGLAGIMIAVSAFPLCLMLRARTVRIPVITPVPVKEKGHTQRIDINTATVEQLQELPGIGPVLAERIAAYREEIGGFAFTYELTDVPGIGAATYDNLCDRITIGS